MLDIESIGAGGGSVAYFDEGSALRVGPRSAGAVPGPVCYGSGEELTVTDANLLLGRIDAGSFPAGAIQLDEDRAREYAGESARRAGVSVPDLANAIIRAANAKMERAIRSVSVERGHDPRDYAMICFGGAGALHACELATALEIPRVVVPAHAGVLSALGMLVADCVRDYSAAVFSEDSRNCVRTLGSCRSPRHASPRLRCRYPIALARLALRGPVLRDQRSRKPRRRLRRHPRQALRVQSRRTAHPNSHRSGARHRTDARGRTSRTSQRHRTSRASPACTCQTAGSGARPWARTRS